MTIHVEVCDKCDVPMERKETLFSELMECTVQIHICPSCGGECEEILS